MIIRSRQKHLALVLMRRWLSSQRKHALDRAWIESRKPNLYGRSLTIWRGNTSLLLRHVPLLVLSLLSLSTP